MDDYYYDWDVDLEYNRIGVGRERKLIDCSKEFFEDAKRHGTIPGQIKTYEELQKSSHAVSVFPDIIVHKRRQPTENLLVVELKKGRNQEVLLGWDQYKIQFFRDVLGYRNGVFIEIKTEADPRGSDFFRMEWT
jgi:hypothetical protein